MSKQINVTKMCIKSLLSSISFLNNTIIEVTFPGKYYIYTGAADPGGPGGPGPPLKLEIYIVNFLEKDRISFFFLLGPPLEKNRSSAPGYRSYLG